MAALELGTLEVELRADTSPLKKAEGEVKKTSNSMEKSFKRVGLAIAAAFSFDAIRRVVLATDALQVMERRLQRFTGSAESADKTFKKLVGTANAVGSEIGNMTAIFERFSLIREDIGATNEQIVVMTDTLAKLGAIGGSSGEEISNSLVQLSQGLAGGVLRAEEFNSIIEQTPEIAKAIGEQMGLSLGEMRKAMLAGELTSDKVFRAILGATEKTNEEFEKMPKSIAMASQALTNDLLVAFSKLDDALGFTNAIAAGMNKMSFEVKRASGELSEQEKILDKIEQTEKKIFNIRRLLTNSRLSGTNREEELQDELFVLNSLIDSEKERLALMQKQQESLMIEITKGVESTGPEQAGAGELEKLAEKLELEFSLTQNANTKLEAEELRHRAAILNMFEEGSEGRRAAGEQLNAWRISEQARVGQEELDAAGKIEADKQNLRLEGLNALSGLIGQTSALISAGVEEGNAAAKAAFIAMKAIQVAQIIASTEAAAAVASVAVAGAGPAAWLASQSGIRTIGYASAGIVAGLSIGQGFEQGGIVGGNSLTGDNVPARVNSKEMILTTRQQSKWLNYILAGYLVLILILMHIHIKAWLEEIARKTDP